MMVVMANALLKRIDYQCRSRIPGTQVKRSSRIERRGHEAGGDDTATDDVAKQREHKECVAALAGLRAICWAQWSQIGT